MNETIKTTGNVDITLRDSSGNIKVQTTVPNLIVTNGKTVIASRLVGTSSAIMSHMAIGSGSTTASVGQTALVAETARVALVSGTNSANVVTYAATFLPATDMSITEAAVLNAASGGTMLCRTVFAAINKLAGDTLSINWQITIN